MMLSSPFGKVWMRMAICTLVACIQCMKSIAQEIITWAQRKHAQIREKHPYASLDRLPMWDLELRYHRCMVTKAAATGADSVWLPPQNKRGNLYSE